MSKKLMICITGALLMAACSTAEKSPVEGQPATANDQQIKDEAEDIQRAKKETLDSINLATIRQRTIDSMNRVSDERQTMTHSAPVRHTPHHAAAAPVPPSGPAVAPANAAPSGGQVASTPSAATTTTPAPKKGLSNGIKGGLIGLGTGAAAGAIIDKNNRGEGAVIGGVVGAVGGAFGGALIDRNKRKKAAEKARQDSINAANASRGNQ